MPWVLFVQKLNHHLVVVFTTSQPDNTRDPDRKGHAYPEPLVRLACTRPPSQSRSG